MAEMRDEHPMMNEGRGRLAGRVAVVTGANRGIGRATARLMAREGASVVGVDIDDSFGPRIDALIASDGGEATFVRCDASAKEGCEEMVDAALSTYGDLHILFNNVGGGTGRFRLHELDEVEWQRSVGLTLGSTFHGVRAALPHFLANHRGVIVNNASTFGLLARPESPAYCAAKAAIVNLTRQLALDYGPEIRVNCVCPGATDTTGQSMRSEEERARSAQLNRAMNRLALPEEIAYGVLFLASDESSFITGHALAIDGGQTIDA